MKKFYALNFKVNKTIILCLCLSLFLISSSAQNNIYLNWQQIKGGAAFTDDSVVYVEAEDDGVITGANITDKNKNSQATIRKYDFNGKQLWSFTYPSVKGSSLVSFICDGAFGDMYGFGSVDTGSNRNALLFKLDGFGKLQWSAVYKGQFNGMDEFADAAIAPNGDIIVVGESEYAGLLCDLIISRYDVNGNPVWQKTGNTQNGESEFTKIQIDALGNAYASGYASNGLNGDGYIAKYDPKGKLLLSKKINGAGNKDDEVKSIELDEDILYVATVGPGKDGLDKAIISAYNTADFSKKWSDVYGSSKGSIDVVKLLCDGLTDNLIVAGTQFGSNGAAQFLTLNYNSHTGGVNWSNLFTRSKEYASIATAMTIDANGNSILAGYSYLMSASVNASSSDIFITSTDTSGAQNYMKVYNGPANGTDVPLDIDVNSKNNVFVGGYSQSLKGDMDMAVLMYTPILICHTPTGLYSSDLTASSVALHWNAMPEALKYIVQYRPVGASTWSQKTSLINSATLTNLLSKTKYQWRVKTVCSTDPSVTSSFTNGVDTFVTPSLLMPVVTQNNAWQSVLETKPQVFPNPAKGIVTVTLNGVKEDAIKITVSDLSGRLLKQFQFAGKGSAFSKQIDMSGLIAGTYLISIATNSVHYSQLLIKE